MGEHKENIRRLLSYKRPVWADKYWKKWYFCATHSRLEPIKKAAKTLKTHLYGIMNFFHPNQQRPREGLNSRIETLWKSACGFCNKERFRTVILFISVASIYTRVPTENPEEPLLKPYQNQSGVANVKSAAGFYLRSRRSPPSGEKVYLIL